MPKVTALDYQAKGGGVRLYLDGTAFGTLAPSDVAALRLTPGLVVDESRLPAIAELADVFAARQVALRMLAARALPSTELVRRLERKGHARAPARKAVRDLAASGLVDDHEFARHYARTRARRLRWGEARLVADLRRLGLPEREAQAAVREALEQEGLEPAAMAREAARRKLKTLAGLDSAARRRRLRAYLRRRGFTASDVREVVRDTLAG